MRAAQLPAHHGWVWIGQGWRIFRTQPMQISVLVMTYGMLWILVTLLSSATGNYGLPLIPIFQLLAPALSVGLLAGARAADQAIAVSPGILFEPLRQGKRTVVALLAIGGIQLACVFLLLWLCFPILNELGDPTTLDLSAAKLTPQQQLIGLRFGAVLASGMLVVSLLLWFAPVLIAWHQLPPVKAIFFGLIAFWRNRLAFLVYLISWAAIGFVALTGIGLLIQLTGLEMLAVPVMMVFMIGLTGTFRCSQYVQYRDVFGSAN